MQKRQRIDHEGKEDSKMVERLRYWLSDGSPLDEGARQVLNATSVEMAASGISHALAHLSLACHAVYESPQKQWFKEQPDWYLFAIAVANVYEELFMTQVLKQINATPPFSMFPPGMTPIIAGYADLSGDMWQPCRAWLASRYGPHRTSEIKSDTWFYGVWRGVWPNGSPAPFRSSSAPKDLAMGSLHPLSLLVWLMYGVESFVPTCSAVFGDLEYSLKRRPKYLLLFKALTVMCWGAVAPRWVPGKKEHAENELRWKPSLDGQYRGIELPISQAPEMLHSSQLSLTVDTFCKRLLLS